ncbi:membrane protein insertase YidC [Pseudogracilibacillus sp. SE30717A]|uniref:membrane protein insertase YidC n=1 Tax=Pseudogracilibacillus sp. SE30717A TaxID=3098293 RepID=UPI00300DF183
MEKNSILTSFRKYSIIILALGALFLLAGCGGDFSPIDESSTGFFNEFIVYPFSLLIKWIAGLLNGSYGLSIIVITIALRLVILPFMVKQQKQSKASQEIMKVIKPEIDTIQEKYKGKQDMEDQLSMQKELRELYQKHDFQPAKMVLGCLPLIIQMPVLIGFYYAIRRTPEIAEQSFLWFSLGETDILLTFIAIFIYYVQARVSLIGLDQNQQGMMAMMVYISPVMIGIISFIMPSALPLYWAVGGLFMIFQTIFLKKFVLNK